MPINYPINVINCDGTNFLVHNEQEALALSPRITQYHRNPIKLSCSHRNSCWNDDQNRVEYFFNEWIARDAYGAIITNDNWPKIERKRHRGYYSAQCIRAAELGLPAPNTGRRRWFNGYRQRSYVGDCRKEPGHIEQMKDAGIAGDRRTHSSKMERLGWWNDESRRHNERCWKRHRKTQWK